MNEPIAIIVVGRPAFGMLAALAYCFWSICIVFGQDVPIEDRVSKDIAERPAVSFMIERLRILRVNEGRIGEKHPSRKKIRSQIEALEKELTERIEQESPQPVPNPFKESIAPRTAPAKREETKPKKSENEPTASDSDASDPGSGRLPRGDWDERDNAPMPEKQADFALKTAYPSLELKELDRVGLFPALGLMWGIENDDTSVKGRIWQWHDHPRAARKSLFWETDGRIEDFPLAPDFEQSGLAFVIRSKGSGKGLWASDEIELVKLTLDRLPPFGPEVGNETILLVGQTLAGMRKYFVDLPDGLLGISVPMGARTTPNPDSCKAFDNGHGLWIIDPTGKSNGLDPRSIETMDIGDNPQARFIARDRSRWIVLDGKPDGWNVCVCDLAGKMPAKRGGLIPLGDPVPGVIVSGDSDDGKVDKLIVGDAATGSIWAFPLMQSGDPPLELCSSSKDIRSIGLDSVGEIVVVAADGLYSIKKNSN